MDIDKQIDHESLYESIINHSDDAIISKSLDGIILSWNIGAEKIFGYRAEEVVGKHISLLIPPNKSNEDNEILQRIRNGEIIHHYETDRIRKDGTVIDISLTVSPIKNKKGVITGASKIARDITDHKLRVDRLVNLVKEIADYKFALDEACIMAITDHKGIINYVNDNFCKISGYTRDELLGKDHRLINSGYHTELFIRDLWVTIANGHIWRGEIRNKAKNGNYYWVDTTIVPFLNEKGKPFRYVAIRSDITDRKLAEEMNQHTQQRYKLVVDNILDCLLITDLYGEIIFTNNQFLILFGISDSGNEIQDLHNFIAPDFLEILNTLSTKYSKYPAPEAAKFDYEGTLSNGNKLWLEVRFCSVMEFGKITGLQFAIRDITRQQSAESERLKAIEDIVQRNKDLEQFSYIVSHNLRSPVANILGITDLITQGGLNEDESDFLMQSLTESTKKLDGIIMDLNHATQIKLSSNENKETIFFSEIVDSILISISQLIEQKDVKVITDFSKMNTCFSVKSYIYSIFYNLITNSIKYKKQDQQLICEIRSETIENNILLTFRDNGIGINLEKTGDQIFELYRRFHMSVAEGKGLGLFMVKTHVECLGGKIQVISEVDKGTEFIVEMPLSVIND